MHQLSPQQQKPAILCLHGAGSSSAVFEVQTAKLRAQLKSDLEFVFVQAPLSSAPGPGMLPLFESAGPFYSWFSVSNRKRQAEVAALHETIKNVLKQHEGKLFVGILGFSQGAVVSTLLLLQQERGELEWLPIMRFAILVCSDFTSEVADYLRSSQVVRDFNSDVSQVAVPTIHLHGVHDPFVPRSRLMLRTHFDAESSQVMEFSGGHHLPQLVQECQIVGELIRVWAAPQRFETIQP